MSPVLRSLAPKQWWPRLRRARMTQALIGYGAIASLVLRATGELRQGFALPPIFTVGVFALLALLLLAVLLTAYADQQVERADAFAFVRGPATEIRLGDGPEPAAPRWLARFTWKRTFVGALVALGLVFGFAGWRLLGAGEAHAAGRAVAVLPFHVIGPGLEVWREGIVDVLSTNLNGAAGIRTVNSRTVLNRWSRELGRQTDPSEEEVLEIARGVGATHAVTGSLVGGGREVRIIARVVDVADGDVEGEAEVKGVPDSVAVLVDRLSMELLRNGLLRSFSALPQVNLRRVTTESLPALKQYLVGEQAFRRSHWPEAIASLQLAVEEDSTFALALYRLSLAVGWEEGLTARKREFSERAARFADKLPERERLLLRASLEFDRQETQAIRTLERLTSRYPDDVEGWYALGDAYFHMGAQALHPRQAFRDALRRALELDPTFGPTHNHLLEDAFDRGDSAYARRLLDSYRQVDAGNLDLRGYELAYDLAWGDSLRQRGASATLDTADTRVLTRAQGSLASPDFFTSLERVCRALQDERHELDKRSGARFALAIGHSRGGRFAEARRELTRLRDEDDSWSLLSARTKLTWRLAGFPDPSDEAAYDEVAKSTDELDLLLAGAVWAQNRKPDVVDSFLAEFEKRHDARTQPAATTPPDTAGSREATPQPPGPQPPTPQPPPPDTGAAEKDAAARNKARATPPPPAPPLQLEAPLALTLRGYAAAQRGDSTAAVADLKRALPSVAAYCPGAYCRVHQALRVELGRLLLGKDDREALRWLRTADVGTDLTVGQLHLARAFEAVEDAEEGRLRYARFVRWWANADEAYAALREEARRGLERLPRALASGR